MAGGKGKGKRSVEQAEHRGGDERGPKKIRKVTQEEMGKRKAKMQIKDRRDKHKPMEPEKVSRLGEKGKKAAAVAEDSAADLITQMTLAKVAYYKEVVAQTDYGNIFIKEDFFPYYPGGPHAARASNILLRACCEVFKEFAASRLDEYAATGRLLECHPEGRRPQ